MFILSVVYIKPVMACSVSWPEGTTPPQPKLEGWITHPEATGFENSNESDYFALQLQPVNTCGGNRIYFHKIFTYATVPAIAILLSSLAIFFFRKKFRAPLP